ncbi:hypothetical protein [Nonomuraea sp. NPDC002799]
MMAGAIGLSPGRIWTSAGWLFDWTLRFIAREVDDPELTATVDELLQKNFGFLNIRLLPEALRETVLQKLRDDLIPAAAAALPDSVYRRQAVLDYLDRLVQLAREFEY